MGRRYGLQLLRRIASLIDFLWLVLQAPGWLYVVLLGCAVAVYFAVGIRALTAPSAWVAFVLFFVWLTASNSWHLLPHPDPKTTPDMVEGWRLWSVHLRETLIVAYLIAGATTTGVAALFVWGAYTQTMRFTMLTALYSFTTFVTQAGEAGQRYVCSTNSPDLGKEYLFWAAGQSEEACGRLSMALGLPDWAGPLFVPTLTGLPPLIILGMTWWKSRAN